MTNEELKEKIVEILEETEYEWTEEKNGYILQIFYDKLADALIVAGIVDKSDYASMKETAVRYKAEVSKAEAKAKEAEHRAEVAERELERYTVLIKPLEAENARLNHLAARAKRALKDL